MDASQYDLETIRRMLAELATRVYRIERRLQLDAQPPAELSGEPKAVPPPSPAPAAPAGARMEPVAAQISFSRSAATLMSRVRHRFMGTGGR